MKQLSDKPVFLKVELAYSSQAIFHLYHCIGKVPYKIKPQCKIRSVAWGRSVGREY